MNNTDNQENDDYDLYVKKCPFLMFCNIMGRKWACPIILNLKVGKKYSFSEIIDFTSRRINRTLLSTMLKEFIKIGILDKKKGKYYITNKGEIVKDNISMIKSLFLRDCKDCIEQIKDECEILEYFKDGGN